MKDALKFIKKVKPSEFEFYMGSTLKDLQRNQKQYMRDMEAKIKVSFGCMTMMFKFLHQIQQTKMQQISKYFYESAVTRVQSHLVVNSPPFYMISKSDNNFYEYSFKSDRLKCRGTVNRILTTYNFLNPSVQIGYDLY